MEFRVVSGLGLLLHDLRAAPPARVEGLGLMNSNPGTKPKA